MHVTAENCCRRGRDRRFFVGGHRETRETTIKMAWRLGCSRLLRGGMFVQTYVYEIMLFKQEYYNYIVKTTQLLFALVKRRQFKNKRISE